MERRLSAIFVADMVGYSRLMEADETGTIERQNAHRSELIDPTIANLNGRIVKTTGDGMLVEFASVVDAVTCAVAIQDVMAEREAAVPEFSRIQYRVGINLGDVVVEGDDLYGDGVNIAARLEQLAEPGGVCISGTAYDHMQSTTGIVCRSLGEVRVKNIERPIRAYMVFTDQDLASGVVEQRPKRTRKHKRSAIAFALIILVVAIGGGAWWVSQKLDINLTSLTPHPLKLPKKSSIAVLPFANMSNDKEQEYFSDGMTEDLITDLSRLSGLMVISRTSTFAYKGKRDDVRKIASELSARYVVEGSVRRIGKRVRITATLTNASTGGQMWSERFDRDMGSLFELQETVRRQIVTALKVKLSSREEKWLSHRLTVDPEAYDLYLRGLQQESFFTADSNLLSRGLFEKAVTRDPSFAAAYSHLAQAHSLAQENGWVPDRKETARKALTLARKAVELDGDLPQAHWALGRILARKPFQDFERAMSSVRSAVELDPNFADGYAYLATLHSSLGRAEEALSFIEKAMTINPNFPFWYLFELGRAQFFLTRHELAASNFRKAMERNPTVPWPHLWLAATYGHLGQTDDAAWEVSEYTSLAANNTIELVRSNTTVRHPVYLNYLAEGLKKAGMPER